MEDTSLAHDLHLSQLVGWTLRRFGVAVLLGAAVAAACGIFAAVGHSAAWLYVGCVVAPLLFGGYLATVSAPLPHGAEAD
jgi:hypothetical protein